MLNRELISWRDLYRCVFAALVMTLVICGGAYIGAGGPVPGFTSKADAATVSHVYAEKLVPRVTIATAVTPAKKAAPLTRRYQIRTGDSLSIISARIYGSTRYWASIYWANKSTIHYANVIYVGQTLIIPNNPRVLSAPALMSPAPPKQSFTATVATVSAPVSHEQSKTDQCGDGDGDGYDIPCSELNHANSPAPASQTNVIASSYHGNGGMQACIIAAESGGNPDIWNATGHWGLYQFSASTWAAHGGNPADFGHASVSEQNQIYYNTVAADGYSDWAPYDGC